MASQFKFFTVPIHDGETGSVELNRFLASQRVLHTRVELVTAPTPCWAVVVEHLAGAAPSGDGANRRGRKARVDYREQLDPADFALYSRLRDLRRELADSDGVPVFAICTNAELAALAQQRPGSLSALQEVRGIGAGKSKRYGAKLLAAIALFETAGPRPTSELPAAPAAAP